MILNEFPDLAWLKTRSEDNFSDRNGWQGRRLVSNGWPSVILHVKSTHPVFRPDIKGPLSLFLNLAGHSFATVDRHRVKIENDRFFLSNSGEHYTLELQESIPTETFNIHFGQDFCEKVVHSLESDSFLMEHFCDKVPSLSFHNLLYSRTPAFDQVINRLASSSQTGMDCPLYLEQCLYELAILLLKDRKDIQRRHHSLPIAKLAVRQEIGKRLDYALDYTHSFYAGALELEELAQVACLSKFHFLRLFKAYTGQSPHQYVNQVRVEKAKLFWKAQPWLEVHQLAGMVGFKDASSFSRVFFHRTGRYPTQYANQ